MNVSSLETPLSDVEIDHRSNSFDILRIVAALMVHCGHQMLLLEIAEPQLAPHYSLATTGLMVFFGMSGFLVSTSVLRGTPPAKYVRSRFLRIWPGMFVYLLFALVLGFGFTSASFSEYFFSAQAFYFVLTNIFPFGTTQEYKTSADMAFGIVGPIWTVKYEVLCYAVLMTSYFVPRRLFPFVAFSMVAVGLIGWKISPNASNPIYTVFHSYFTFQFFFWFGIGAIMAFEFSLSKTVSRILFAIMLTSVLLSQSFLSVSMVTGLVCATAVAFGASSYLSGITRGYDISFGLYLYSWTIMITTKALFPIYDYFWLNVFLPISLTAVLAFISWELIEKPALSLKNFNADTLNRGQPISRMLAGIVIILGIGLAGAIISRSIPAPQPNAFAIDAALAALQNARSGLSSSSAIHGYVDSVTLSDGSVAVNGWAVNDVDTAPLSFVMFADEKAIGITRAFGRRPDIKTPPGVQTMFSIRSNASCSEGQTLTILAVSPAGEFNSIPFWKSDGRC